MRTIWNDDYVLAALLHTRWIGRYGSSTKCCWSISGNGMPNASQCSGVSVSASDRRRNGVPVSAPVDEQFDVVRCSACGGDGVVVVCCELMLLLLLLSLLLLLLLLCNNAASSGAIALSPMLRSSRVATGTPALGVRGGESRDCALWCLSGRGGNVPPGNSDNTDNNVRHTRLVGEPYSRIYQSAK
jgi:hypothetical protein